MREKTNNNWIEMSDIAIINKIGKFIKHTRLEQNKTQAQLAEEAGINRWTVSQFENGESVTISTLIQIMRVLDLLHLLEIFEIDEKISPIEYAKLKEKKRRRARASKIDKKSEENEEW